MHHRFAPVFLLLLVAAALSHAVDKPRVFITDSQSWEVSGSAGGANGAFAAQTHGGARPQTAEIVKTFGERCPDVLVNNIREKSDYVVVLDHEGGKGWARKDNKVAVFNKDGDSIVSKSTRTLGNSVQEACNAVVSDWSKRGPITNAAQKDSTEAPPKIAAPAQSDALQSNTVRVAVDPGIPGAEIEVDDAFVGTTPSTVDLTIGEHNIKISKSGYQTWERRIKVSGGAVNISPQLEKE